MEYFTNKAPYELVIKLKEAGFPQNLQTHWFANGKRPDHNAPDCDAPNYAQILDWLIDKDLSLEPIVLSSGWEIDVYRISAPTTHLYSAGIYKEWKDAMNDAIENALILISNGHTENFH